MVLSLKCIFTSLPRKTKNSIRVKNLMAGKGDWICVKEVLRWMIDTKAGTVALPE